MERVKLSIITVHPDILTLIVIGMILGLGHFYEPRNKRVI
jgi:hypothetical protein